MNSPSFFKLWSHCRPLNPKRASGMDQLSNWNARSGNRELIQTIRKWVIIGRLWPKCLHVDPLRQECWATFLGTRGWASRMVSLSFSLSRKGGEKEFMTADVMTVSQQKLWLPQGRPNCQDHKGPCLVTVCHAKAGESNCFKQAPPLESQPSWLWADTLLIHIVSRFSFFKYQNYACF